MVYITAATTTTIVDATNGILIQNNLTQAGTITVKDGGTTKAVVTAPTVGLQFRYYGFTGQVTIVTSATSDITVSILNNAV